MVSRVKLLLSKLHEQMTHRFQQMFALQSLKSKASDGLIVQLYLSTPTLLSTSAFQAPVIEGIIIWKQFMPPSTYYHKINCG